MLSASSSLWRGFYPGRPNDKPTYRATVADIDESLVGVLPGFDDQAREILELVLDIRRL